MKVSGGIIRHIFPDPSRVLLAQLQVETVETCFSVGFGNWFHVVCSFGTCHRLLLYKLYFNECVWSHDFFKKSESEETLDLHVNCTTYRL